ncbi:MAG: NUDIX domain-containing protein [Clostridiaceae bacterium]|nr:NUDIX domain-containing protein [Clostridiaceae bacterium]
MGIRSAAKAIVIHDGKVLLNICYDKNNGKYFSLPGGGQKMYESLHEAITRECLEETGYTVHIDKFAALYEEICDDEGFRSNYPDYAHKMYHIFICRLQNNHKERPIEIDAMQEKSEWVEIGNLSKITILPKAVGDNMSSIMNSEVPLFLGSEHILFNHG